MSFIAKVGIMPTKLRYKLVVSFCLMSLLPILVGIYIASLLIEFPFVVNTTNVMTVSLVLFVSLTLSLLGYLITRQMVIPLLDVAAAAKRIAQGDWEGEGITAKGSEEVEELSRSLQEISRNAKELLEKVERLSFKDKLTGLYNASYIRERLNEEIQRAIQYQRPCSFVYLKLVHLDEFASLYGPGTYEEALRSIAKVFGDELSELDRAARVTKDEFALIFPNRNKKKAIEISEKILHTIEALAWMRRAQGDKCPLAVAIGVSEDPLDGTTAQDLYAKAVDRARKASLKQAGVIEAFAE